MGLERTTPQRMQHLERATRLNQRVVLKRRGTEVIVVARRLLHHGGQEALVGLLPMTGEELRFDLEDLDDFQVRP